MGRVNRKILIVEDEILVAETIKRSLIHNGYDVTGIAMSGDHAIDSANENPPDVAIVDIVLRDSTDGIDVARKIHDRHGTSIIFLTAHSGMDMYARAREVEHSAYIIKPFQEKQVLDAIQYVLKDAT